MGVTAFDSEPDKWLGFQRRRDEFLQSDDRFMWRIDTFLDERSGYFFEMNPSGLMADAVFGVNGDEPRVGRHLERARPPQRDRLDDRDRDPVPHAQLRSRQRHLGHQLPAHRPAEERRQHLDGLGAQPGARPHDQRRPRHGHHATSRQGTGLDIKPYGLFATDASRRGRGGWRSRPRTRASTSSTTRRRPARQPHDQHRLRADRGRSAPGQPDALLPVLSRAARLLPRRRHLLRLRQQPTIGGEQVQPVLQPPHRPERRRRRRSGSTTAPSSPARWAARTSASCTCGPATTTTSGFIGEDFTVARVKRRHVSRSPTSAAIYTQPRLRAATGARRQPHRRRSTSACHQRGSAATRTSTASGWFLHATPSRRDAAARSAFGVAVDYPNDRWTGGVNAREVQAELRPGGRLRHAPQLPPLQPVRRLRPAAAQQPRGAAVQFTATWTCSPTCTTSLLERNVHLHAAEHAVPEPGQRSPSSSIATYDPARRAVPDQPRHHAARWQASTTSPAFALHGQTANRRMLALNGRFETGGFYSGTRQQTIARPDGPRAAGLHLQPQRRVEPGGPGRRAASRRTCSA